MKKFVDLLPGDPGRSRSVTPRPANGYGAAGANNLGQCDPPRRAEGSRRLPYPGCRLLRDRRGRVRGARCTRRCPPTRLRGYVQLSTANVPGKQLPVVTARRQSGPDARRHPGTGRGPSPTTWGRPSWPMGRDARRRCPPRATRCRSASSSTTCFPARPPAATSSCRWTRPFRVPGWDRRSGCGGRASTRRTAAPSTSTGTTPCRSATERPTHRSPRRGRGDVLPGRRGRFYNVPDMFPSDRRLAHPRAGAMTALHGRDERPAHVLPPDHTYRITRLNISKRARPRATS